MIAPSSFATTISRDILQYVLPTFLMFCLFLPLVIIKSNIEDLFVVAILFGYFFSHFISLLAINLLDSFGSRERSKLYQKMLEQGKRWDYFKMDLLLSKGESDNILMISAYCEFYLQCSGLFLCYFFLNMVFIASCIIIRFFELNCSFFSLFTTVTFEKILEVKTVTFLGEANTALLVIISLLLFSVARRYYLSVFEYLYLKLYPELAKKYGCASFRSQFTSKL